MVPGGPISGNLRTTWLTSHQLHHATSKEPHLADDRAIRGPCAKGHRYQEMRHPRWRPPASGCGLFAMAGRVSFVLHG